MVQRKDRIKPTPFELSLAHHTASLAFCGLMNRIGEKLSNTPSVMGIFICSYGGMGTDVGR